ncbi:MAG: TatD family hydrolase [Ottowia sp.]|nr:TatD family hydrolase [Ottowia sp.]
MFTDSHCHLVMPELAEQLPQVLEAMQQARVTRALTVCTTMEEFPAVCAQIEAHPQLWGSVGVHPENEPGACAEADEAALVRAAQHPRVVAIGETGLDYYQMDERKGGRSIADLEWQRERFRCHIRAAHAACLPLIIHMRSAADDTLAILREEGAERAGGVFHCFTETKDVARAALDMGFYISISGIVTFKNAREVHEAAAYVPEDRLLIETDAPYLAPVPHRGRLNQPAYVAHTAACIAELRGVDVERIARTTWDNFNSLFTKVNA